MTMQNLFGINKISLFILRLQLKKKWIFGKYREKKIFNKYNKIFQKSLDLGCGDNPTNYFNSSNQYGLDINLNEENDFFKICDLSFEAIPFEDNFFDCVSAYDLLEHIPRVSIVNNKTEFPFINLMNEVYRVLSVDGVFYSRTPAFPFKQAFQDPTHVNFITEDTFDLYFCNSLWALRYGFKGNFKILHEGWNGDHYYCMLKKVKCF